MSSAEIVGGNTGNGRVQMTVNGDERDRSIYFKIGVVCQTDDAINLILADESQTLLLSICIIVGDHQYVFITAFH